MAGEGISIKAAMAKWHLTQAQAEQLDKMDDDSDNGKKGNGKISGSIYDMAKTYYEESHKGDNAKEANRPKLFNDLVSWIKETKQMMEMMKNGAFEGDEQEVDESENTTQKN